MAMQAEALSAHTAGSPTARPHGGCTIDRWEPEDELFWRDAAARVASRNLWVSVPALLLAFSVWTVFSVVAVKLPQVGFAFTESERFWLAALPGLSGATLRIFYAFMVPIFGGRNWTAVSTASLLLPAIGLGFAVRDVTTPYWVFVSLSLLAGLGGANFASSMANISFFYPKRVKGAALGINAGLGNLGVSVAQFVVPMVISVGLFGTYGGEGQQVLVKGTPTGSTMFLQNIGFVWVLPIVVVTVLAVLLMNNLTSARASVREQAVIFRRKHNWVVCWLYMGTFGSFIGFSAALPMLLAGQFPTVDPLKVAFLGPLVGALIRPVGGWLGDKLGGARVTFWNYIAMALATVGVLIALNAGSFGWFLGLFIVLFATTGIGNGSVFRMIPAMFVTLHQRSAGAAGGDTAIRQAAKEAAAVMGFASAIAAYGMFFIPKLFGWAKDAFGSPQPALLLFIAFYVTCIAITWWYYGRRNAELPC